MFSSGALFELWDIMKVNYCQQRGGEKDCGTEGERALREDYGHIYRLRFKDRDDIVANMLSSQAIM